MQAKLFNDPANDFKVVVATDAIGMGLNLNIKRVVFSSVVKFDGLEERMLSVSEVKQIAGRAGRFKSRFPVGEVSAFSRADLRHVHNALNYPLYDLMHLFNLFAKKVRVCRELILRSLGSPRTTNMPCSSRTTSRSPCSRNSFRSEFRILSSLISSRACQRSPTNLQWPTTRTCTLLPARWTAFPLSSRLPSFPSSFSISTYILVSLLVW